MTRTLFTGGRVLDGTGADPAETDLVVEDGRIVEVGRGLDGDDSVDLAGKAVLPGLFDCHTHVVVSSIDTMRLIQTPFSYRFFQAAANLPDSVGQSECLNEILSFWSNRLICHTSSPANCNQIAINGPF